MDNWVLFRGGAEWSIREGFLEDDLIECVIGLPDNLFYNTSAPWCIVIVNNNKSQERKWKVLFIDASREFEQGKKQNKLRSEDIDRIVETYSEFAELWKYSIVSTLEQIKENDYNLNIARYVDMSNAEESVDIQLIYNQIKDLKAERDRTSQEVDDYMQELWFY